MPAARLLKALPSCRELQLHAEEGLKRRVKSCLSLGTGIVRVPSFCAHRGRQPAVTPRACAVTTSPHRLHVKSPERHRSLSPGGRCSRSRSPHGHGHPTHRGTSRTRSPEPHHLHTGELGWKTDFTEHYSMLEVIGRGAFGVVWLAVRKHDGHQVAVKVLPKKRNELTREESLANIKREVALWGNISSTSRYVAQLIGLYEDAGSVYLVQQLCTGGDLASAIKDGPLPESCAAAVMWCVMAAIRDCHEHRTAFIDVKPANFLLTSAPGSTGSTASAAGSTESTSPGSSVADLRLADVVASGCGGPCVVACDFGCSASYAELMRGAKRAGSPVFFAPEQFTSSYGLGVDVWAAGVMAYLVLTGRYPFWDCPRDEMEGQMPAYQIMLAVCSAPISFSGPEWRGVSREARDLVSRMLDRNPGTRITAAEALEHPWFQRWKNAPPSAPAGSTSTSAAASTASAPGSPRRDAGQRRSSNSAPSTPRVRPRPGPSTLAPAPAAPAPVRVPEPAAAASASADSADERAADHELQVQPPQPQPQRSPAGAVPRRRTSSGGAGLGNIVPLTFSASAAAIAAAANASQAAEPRVVLPASAQQPMLSDASEDETACVQEPYRTPAGASPSH